MPGDFSVFNFPTRVLPQLPPLIFGAQECLPRHRAGTAAGSLPVQLQLYRRQRIRRALGLLPARAP